MTHRIAWVMRLKPGNEAIYKQKHDEIWPEMLANMKRDGVRSFSIYLHGLDLFAYMERDSAPPPEGRGAPNGGEHAQMCTTGQVSVRVMPSRFCTFETTSLPSSSTLRASARTITS